MSTLPEFPTPIRLRGRLFFRRHDLERYKRALLVAHGLVKPDEPMPDLGREELVNAGDAAKELGFGRRTIGRRIAGKQTEAA
ncbi:hypothetical protein [Methylosinus sp. Ce-a6]|uniref:hypothetical protein n=1 Tax=Methylosinus sp. Ce-a6 TaxID=2172005 RepID=UPI0013577CEC|nr:hypothetical protein [Methylosinus sp. Ce-a6]